MVLTARRGEASEISRETWRTIRIVLAVLVFQGYADAIPSIASPWIASGFKLSEPALARVFAWLAFASVGSLFLARMADRIGRRRILICSVALMPLFAFGAATASNLTAFISFMVCLNMLLGASLASSIVMLAEILPVERRADGQSWGGLAATLGAGLCVVLMPVLEWFGLSWRWLLVIPITVVAIFPHLLTIPETAQWQRASDRIATRQVRFQDVFGPLFLRRSVTIIVAGLILAFANEGITTYAYFHAISDVRLSAVLTSVFTIVGGGIGMLGFPLGAWSAERFGRVPTIVGYGAATAVSALGYYWGPPLNFVHPAFWLGVTFLLWNAAINAVQVASYAAVTELFPASLRGTMMGWFALVTAIGAPAAEGTIAALAKRAGGIAEITGWLGLLGLLSAVLYGIALDESRGLPLETAGREAEFYSN